MVGSFILVTLVGSTSGLPATVWAQTSPTAVAPVGTSTENITPTTTVSDAVAAAIAPAAVQPYAIESISDTGVAIGDFVVGPGRIEVEVKPGQTVTKMMTVTNRITANRTFELSVEDMSGSADASDAVVLLGDQKGPYTLKDNISYPSRTFSLNLNERAQIPVSITMPPNAEPGGYYGAVLVSTVQDSAEKTDDTVATSPIIARIGTLFFIRVPGPTEISGSIKELATKNNQWLFAKGPIDLSILFENTGSIHLNPYGDITVTNMLGESVGFVELEPWFVLPKSLRLREVTWDRELLFGRYTITANINLGYNDTVEQKSIYIWVLPWKLLVSVFAVLFILIALIRFFFKSFEFKRKGS